LCASNRNLIKGAEAPGFGHSIVRLAFTRLRLLIFTLTIVNKGNGYQTRQISKGLSKEQTLMLSTAATFHNYLLFYAHSLRLIDQTETFSLAHRPIYAGMFVF